MCFIFLSHRIASTKAIQIVHKNAVLAPYAAHLWISGILRHSELAMLMTKDLPFAELFGHAEAACAGIAADAVQVPIGFLQDLTHAASGNEVLQAYSQWSKRIVDADRCSIALDGPDNKLNVTAMNNDSGLEPPARFSIDDTVLGAVYRQRRPAYAPDMSVVDSHGVKLLTEQGYRSVILVPLLTNVRCFGVIGTTFVDDVRDPGSIIRILEAIGRCLAMQLQVIEQMEKLAQMARTDALTGAGNRRLLYEHAAESWDKWQQNRLVFSYLTIDIDHFKQINDTYGHDVGDAVLSAFAQRMRGHLRKRDILIRTGGEEFGVLMMDATLEQATEVAIRLCDVMGATPFAVEGMQLLVTASFGLTSVNPEDLSFEDMLKRADQALYEAKLGGRDQVVVRLSEEMAA